MATQTADDALIAGEASPEDEQQTGAARSAGELAAPGDFTLAARHQWDRTQALKRGGGQAII